MPLLLRLLPFALPLIRRALRSPAVRSRLHLRPLGRDGRPRDRRRDDLEDQAG